VTAVPGETPRSPLTVEVPVLVTVEPPRTAKLDDVPSVGAVATAGTPRRAEKGATVLADTAADRLVVKRTMTMTSGIIKYAIFFTIGPHSLSLVRHVWRATNRTPPKAR